jgi:anti-sigma regulatory factor (Ser/Thr protein kinase)
MIAVGELVANAVRHGGSQFVVGMARTPGGLRVMVSDSSPAAPKPGAPTSLDLGGRGLHMVETVTSGWGYRLDGTGKVVWADLALPETASQAS